MFSDDAGKAVGVSEAGKTRVPEGGEGKTPTRELLPGGPLDIGPTQHEFAPTIHRVYRRPLGAGLGPAPLLGALSALALLAGLVLLFTGSVIVGLIVLALTLALIALFRAATRSEPDSQAARLAGVAEDRARSGTRLAAATGRAWSRAAPEIVRIRMRQQRLHRELKAKLQPLGEAVHRGDQERVQELKAQTSELESAIRKADHEAALVRDELEHDVERERATSTRTEALPQLTTRAGRSRRPGS